MSVWAAKHVGLFLASIFHITPFTPCNHSSKLLYLPITLTNYHVFDPLISIESSFRLIYLSENKSNRLPPSLLIILRKKKKTKNMLKHTWMPQIVGDSVYCVNLHYVITSIYNISILDHIGPYYPNIFQTSSWVLNPNICSLSPNPHVA